MTLFIAYCNCFLGYAKKPIDLGLFATELNLPPFVSHHSFTLKIALCALGAEIVKRTCCLNKKAVQMRLKDLIFCFLGGNEIRPFLKSLSVFNYF